MKYRNSSKPKTLAEIAIKKTVMKQAMIGLIFLISTINLLGQVAADGRIMFAKEFSKDISLYHAKTFVIQDVLKDSSDVVRFEVDPLAAASSGELTTLVYTCTSQKKAGLILGFFGNKWNSSGVNYQAYAFKNLPEKKAYELLEKIESAITDNSKYLNADYDNNNITFQYDDLTILVYNTTYSTKLRIYWGSFDSEWEYSEFRKTKKRLQKKLN